MGCLYCRKNIGPVRRLRDRHFCSEDHRKKYSKSARALREAEDLYGFDEIPETSWRVVTAVRPEDKSDRKAGMGTTIFVGLAVVVLVLVFSQLHTNSPGPKIISALPDTNPHPNQGGFGQMIGNLIQSQTSGTLRDDFHTGLGGWEGLRSSNSDWDTQAGEVRPASLRLWKPSTSLTNYELEFQGHIDRKSMDWAFRAADLHNYYATKLVITRPGPAPQRRPGSFCSAGWARARARGTAAASYARPRRRLPRARQRAGRSLPHFGQRPVDQLLDG